MNTASRVGITDEIKQLVAVAQIHNTHKKLHISKTTTRSIRTLSVKIPRRGSKEFIVIVTPYKHRCGKIAA